MGKRKANGAESKPPTKDAMDVDESGSGSGSEAVSVYASIVMTTAANTQSQDNDILDVDFEYFDPSPTIDFHGLKTLLRQLFDVDNQLLDLSELSDMILAQPLLGSTVKCDGPESDPYAFLTVLNLHAHRSKPIIKQLTAYLLARIRAQPSALTQHLTSLLDDPANSSAQIGLILTERFINIPHQIVPPMYNMLLEEIRWANDEKEPYQFTHYLVISKTYTEVESKLDVEDDRPPQPKKSKKSGGAAGPEVFYFHPEDEALQRCAMGSCSFEYERQGEEGSSDAKRAFQDVGVKPMGHLILIEGGKFEGAVKAVESYIGGAAA